MKIADVTLEVVKKDIKNIHLSVNPPSGHVKLAVPHSTSANVIRAFALSKLNWIRKNQKKMRTQEREKPKLFIERESHYIWGRRYLLHVIESTDKASLKVTAKKINLHKRPNVSFLTISKVFDQYYKNELSEIAEPKIVKWAKALGVAVPKLEARKMKTRWGSCNVRNKVIRLNFHLAKYSKELLNYVILHEIAHFLERNHNKKYFEILDFHMPNWRHYRNELGKVPVPYENNKPLSR